MKSISNRTSGAAITMLSLQMLVVGLQGDLMAQCALDCPPQRFQSNANLVPNPDFEIVGPCGPVAWIMNGGGSCMANGVAWSAAANWRLHGDNFGNLVQSSSVPTNLPVGGQARMLRLQALGMESGIYQPYQMPPGVNSIMFSVWVKVIRGQAQIGVNSMVNQGPTAFSTKIGEWEQLRVCTNGTRVDWLHIYNQGAGGGEFYVDRIEVRAIN